LCLPLCLPILLPVLVRSGLRTTLHRALRWSAVHSAKAKKIGYGWSSECKDCGWIGDDHPGHDSKSEASAIEDAAMHSRGEWRPWSRPVSEPVTPWSPERHWLDPGIWGGGR